MREIKRGVRRAGPKSDAYRVRAGHGLTPRNGRTEALAIPWPALARACLRGFRRRPSPENVVKPRSGGTVRPRTRVDPVSLRSATRSRPVRPAVTAACAAVPTAVRPDRSGIPCRSTALVVGVPCGTTSRPGPGVAREQDQTFARSSCLPGKTSDRTGNLASEGREARRNFSCPGGPFVCFSCHHPSRAGALAQAFRRASQIVLPFPRALACREKDWQRIGRSGTIKRREFEFFC
jgi:hypothetical protein